MEQRPANMPIPHDEMESYDLDRDRAALNALVGSKEVDALTGEIYIDDLSTILSFGADASKSIASTSDEVLRRMSKAAVSDSGSLLNALMDIMKRFDVDEISGEQSLLGRLFGSPKKQIDRILEKYQAMGTEIDRVFVRLKQYEAELLADNRAIQQLFDANVDSYHMLVKYILAAEQAREEIRSYLDQLNADYAATHDESLSFQIQTVQNSLDLLERRLQDLKTTEIVAMQTIPMLKMMQMNNAVLLQKINSAFLITLPVFKQSLAQAILFKRQRMQAEALTALDRRASEMLSRNARNTAKQASLSASITANTRSEIEALQAARATICKGVDEMRVLQEKSELDRREDSRKLETLRRGL